MTSTQTLVAILIVCAVVGLRVYRQSREQRWLVGRMWILPAMVLAVTVIAVGIDTTHSVLAPLAGVLGLAAGVGIGLYQVNHTTLRIDKPSKAVFIKVTPLG